MINFRGHIIEDGAISYISPLEQSFQHTWRFTIIVDGVTREIKFEKIWNDVDIAALEQDYNSFVKYVIDTEE